MRARATHLGLVTWLAACSWMVPATAGAATPLQSFVVVTATDGITGSYHTAAVGRSLTVEAAAIFANFAFLDAPNAEPFVPIDVYVGTILPDGRFTSWVGAPLGSTFVTGPAPVPLFAGIVPSVGTFNVYRSLTFATPGWNVLYGLVVRAGANPLDPQEWAGWNPRRVLSAPRHPVSGRSMRLSVLAACLALTSVFVPSGASAVGPCPSVRGGPVDVPAVPLVELADVVLALRPSSSSRGSNRSARVPSA